MPSESLVRLVVWPGVGGTEALAWSALLAKQYRSWLQRFQHKFQEDNSELGAFEFEISENTAKQLTGEFGIHRLVRIPPQSQLGHRQISFAMVYLDGQDGVAEQIRTYVFDPAPLLKNDLTGESNTLVNEVLNGDLSSAP